MRTVNETILKLENVTKVYPNGVVANKNINMEFLKGEIHSIVGENGAGKSTLMKMIFGNETPSSGTIIYKGAKVRFKGSIEAIQSGIGMVHQHFMLIPSMTVVQNIVMGDEPCKWKTFVNYREAVNQTRQLAGKYHLDVDVTKKVEELSAGEKQKVEILKTLYRKAELIILDEPTSVLTPQETETLFQELKKLRELGHTILFISHKLNEVTRISDRISVMRNGESKGTYNNSDITVEKLTELIVGRKVVSSYDEYRHEVQNKEAILTVRDLTLQGKTKPLIDHISFTVRSGEILGVAGVQGNGQTELVRAIFGTGEMDSGEVFLKQKGITGLSVKQRREIGLSYIPEDRIRDGIAGEAAVSDNIISSYYTRPDINGKLIMKKHRIEEISRQLVDKFAIKTQSISTKAGSLSGGNMQKVVVAREAFTEPVCMLAEQPTQGIDIGSAEFIRIQLLEMRNRGAGILLVSADLEEILSLSDRMIVLYNGAVSAYFPSVEGLSLNEIGLYMLGVKKQTEEEVREAMNG